MPSQLKYPTVDEIVQLNRRIIEEIRVSKRDRHGLLMGDYGRSKVKTAVESAKRDKGDAYAKAAVLLIRLNRGHPFESANKRTAAVAASEFLASNGYPVASIDSDMMKGVRAGMYKKSDVRTWLKGA